MSEVTCDEVRDLLPDLTLERVAGRLDLARAEAVDAHTAVCVECALEREIVEALAVDLTEVPDGLAEEIRRAVRAEMAASSRGFDAAAEGRRLVAAVRARWRARAPAWASAAVLVLAAGGALLWLKAPPAGVTGGGAAPLDLAPSVGVATSVWLAGDGMVAGAPLLDDLSDLSDEDLRALLAEMEG